MVKGPAQPSNTNGQNEEGNGTQGEMPWLLHSMSVNALNFCAFSICPVPTSISNSTSTAIPETTDTFEVKPEPGLATEVVSDTTDKAMGMETMPKASNTLDPTPRPLLLASPNGLDSSGIDIFHLPTEHRVSQIRSIKDTKTGMVMALNLSFDAAQNRLLLTSGYEDGSVAVHEMTDLEVLDPSLPTSRAWKWKQILVSRPHSQPVLSLDVTPDDTSFITSSADAIIVKFAIPAHEDTEIAVGSSSPDKTNSTKHAGQQDLKIRTDGKIFVTAGWDGSLRVYSGKTCKELAVLQWHREGCYAVAFADVLPEDQSKHGNEKDANETTERALTQMNAMDRMKSERDRKVHNTHWIVAGSKDGKISLWDIY